MDIIQYDKNFEALLFNLLMDEGDDWSDYHGQAGRSQYNKALESYEKMELSEEERAKYDDFKKNLSNMKGINDEILSDANKLNNLSGDEKAQLCARLTYSVTAGDWDQSMSKVTSSLEILINYVNENEGNMLVDQSQSDANFANIY